MTIPSEFRAFQAVTDGEAVERGVVTMAAADLPAEQPDRVAVEVHWSSVNYKDGLASTPTGRVARISPIVPGVDLAGVLLEDAPQKGGTVVPAGTEVIVHGYDLGVAQHGGFAEYARVPADWVVPLPAGLTMREAMTFGTAGFTAALSVIALQEHAVTPDRGQVLVTGATGGVGSTAVSMLAGLGYEVVASTGKPNEAGWLRDLGAAEVLDRAELGEEGKRPLESTVWAGAVDCVGGVTLANVLKKIHYGGSVAASGLTGGAGLPTTVMPFILRGVNLLGIDSVMTPLDRRRQVWARMATDLKPAGLGAIGHAIGLDQLDATLTEILAGGATGRSVVALRGG
ncbi:MAG TPA: acryloyl-CoA reductase [Ilumatobacter sp.]|nr:acryloyl-CoA reductase [Ilumatobacter sp.]